jgi:GNAT superfamily N-acetyltransferase
MTSRRWLTKVLGGAFPREHTLEDGTTLTLRPLRAEDEASLKAYFHRIPEEERSRFMRNNVVDPVVVRNWCQEIDVSRVIPLVALDGDRIVADATLHLGQPGIKSHVGQLRFSDDPDYRAGGAAGLMVSELLDIAPEIGLAWVDAEAQAGDLSWIALLESKAFKIAGRLPDHARDNLGNHEDLIHFTRSVENPFRRETGGEG